MITSLELEKYRRFEKYRLDHLARVNLLVGKNNCGKTSILQAIQLLASRGHQAAFADIALARGESTFELVEKDGPAFATVAHFFFGHRVGPESRFSIRSIGDLGELDVYFANDDLLKSDPVKYEDVIDNLERSQPGWVDTQLIAEWSESTASDSGMMSYLNVAADGAFDANRHRRSVFSSRGEVIDFDRVVFVSAESLDRESMSRMWNRVIQDGAESRIVQSLRILEPTLSSVAFLTGSISTLQGKFPGVLLGFGNNGKRVPLGSYGEGMRRCLALALALQQSAGGVLLIDEVDTGLHYSVLGDVWRLLIQGAIDFNVQIFATTHSYDCMRGLAKLCEQHPDLSQHVALQKIDERLDQAVALDAGKIQQAIESGIEVR